MMDSVWAITQVKNEEDIIQHTLKNFVDQGVDGFIIRDNGSTDDTVDKIKAFTVTSPVPVIFSQDEPNSPYNQSLNMTHMARRASMLGARHIIPFDADEFWFSRFGRVADMIREADANVGHVLQRFYYATIHDDVKIQNPYERLQYRTIKPRPWRKVFFRYESGVIVGSGNHELFAEWRQTVVPDRRFEKTGVEIGHFPCRSIHQMVDKIIRHGIAMDIQYPCDPTWNSDGPAHNYLYRLYQREGIQALSKIWNSGSAVGDQSGFLCVTDVAAYGLEKKPIYEQLRGVI